VAIRHNSSVTFIKITAKARNKHPLRLAAMCDAGLPVAPTLRESKFHLSRWVKLTPANK
jgi:hypothetical protein